jgi:hypothetical protein
MARYQPGKIELEVVMLEFGICQACAASVAAGLRKRRGDIRKSAGCCVQCHSFACGFHGERELHTQQFRCVECLPSFVLYSAVLHSGAQTQVAKEILARQPAWSVGRNAWRIDNPESFLELHDLVRDGTNETLSEFYDQCCFDLDQPELQHQEWATAVRDLRRMQFRLDPTPQHDLLKLAASYLAFIYSQQTQNSLPLDMQVLWSAMLRTSSKTQRERVLSLSAAELCAPASVHLVRK